jgi:hypothetical protein
MQSKNANPLDQYDIEFIREYLMQTPHASLSDVAQHLRDTGRIPNIGVPGLKQRALKSGYILRSRLSLDPLFPKGNVDK